MGHFLRNYVFFLCKFDSCYSFYVIHLLLLNNYGVVGFFGVGEGGKEVKEQKLVDGGWGGLRCQRANVEGWGRKLFSSLRNFVFRNPVGHL